MIRNVMPPFLLEKSQASKMNKHSVWLLGLHAISVLACREIYMCYHLRMINCPDHLAVRHNQDVYPACHADVKAVRPISRGRGTLAQERPDLGREWDAEANRSVTPETVQAGSDYMATWRCGKCCKQCGKAHVWQATVRGRACKRQNCPLCNGHKVCSCQSLAEQRKDLMNEWDAEGNARMDPPLNPWSLGLGSAKKALWKCEKHGIWPASILNRTTGATGCPGCAKDALRLPRSRRGLLKDEFPEVYAQLHPTLNGDLGFAGHITSGSQKMLWWLCPGSHNRPAGCTCEHAWQAEVQRRCCKRSGCPFCYGQRVCPCNSIAQVQRGSLIFWHFGKNKDVSPQEVSPGSRKKVWWRHVCPTTGEEHEWQALVQKLTRAYWENGAAPCPVCARRANKNRLAHVSPMP